MPTPSRSSVSPSPSPNRRGTTPSRNADIFEGLSDPPPDPSFWLPEQRHQFMQALMNASPSPLPASSPIGEPSMPMDPSLPPIDNPFAALLAAQAGGESGAGVFPPFAPGMIGKAPMDDQVPEPTTLQKAMPLLHILAMWCLLAYFVLWAEPQMYSAVNREDEVAVGLWRRWAELGRRSPLVENITQAFRVQLVVCYFLPHTHIADLTCNIPAFFLGLYDSPDSSTFTANIFWFCEISLTSPSVLYLLTVICLEFCPASDASRSCSATSTTTFSLDN